MHHNFDDSDSGYDVDTDRRQGQSFGVGGYKGRIIFLGDGTEVLTDSDDTEMFDNAEEDKDLASQVSKGTSHDDVSDEPESASEKEESIAKEPGHTGPSADKVPAVSDASSGPVEEKKAGGDAES